MKPDDHPTVRRSRELERVGAISERRPFCAGESTALALECGTGDVGFSVIDRTERESQHDEILRHDTVIEAADGQAGRKVVRSNVRIDLLVTDVGLIGS